MIPRNLRTLTFEELEDLEQELHMQSAESNYSLVQQQVRVYQEMHNRLRRMSMENGEYNDYYTDVKSRLLILLIKYGTYLKMLDEKDDNAAVNCLKEALRIDKTNPIASYRLGFLSYRHGGYQEALNYFQNALNYNLNSADNRFSLNDQQLVNAHLYLTNSALHMAKDTYSQMNKLTIEGPQPLPNYEFSSLFQLLNENDRYLNSHAFYKITQDQKERCSKEECEHLLDHPPRNTIILYFNDRDIKLGFNEEIDTLRQGDGDLLRFLLTISSLEKPVTRFTASHLFESSRNDGVMSNDTFRQRVSRLRNKLKGVQQMPEVIHTTRYMEETAYYFEGCIPFIIMYRVDEEMNI